MKYVLFVVFLLGSNLVFSQSIIQSDYSNIGSKWLNAGISKNAGNDDYIVHFASGYRYRIINSGIDISSTLGDSLISLKNIYATAKMGIAVPLHHSKRATTTINVNGTANAFDRLDNDKINAAFGYEAYVKYNTAFASVELGYSGNPDSDKETLRRKGAYVKLSIGLNEFFSKEEGWSLTNYEEGNDSYTTSKPKKGDKVQGTGFAISEEGYIVTNYHVVENGKKIKILGVNGNMDQELEAKVIVVDKEADLAILKVNKNIGTLPYSLKTKEAISGKKVYTLGYPKQNILGNNIKITEGLINSTSGLRDDNKVYQISAPVTNGNSGGPLFDNYGNIIGVVSSGYRDSTSDLINYAVKSNNITPLLDEASIAGVGAKDYNTEVVEGSIIANEYNKFVYIIIVEH